MKTKEKFYEIIRWILLVPSILLFSILFIYPFILFSPNEDIGFLIKALISLGVPMIQVSVANWVAPQHKKAVSLTVFIIISALFLISLITIFLEATLVSGLLSSVLYFFEELYPELLRPIGAVFVICKLGYFERKKGIKNLKQA